MKTTTKAFAGLVCVSAVIAACSSGTSEPVSPEASSAPAMTADAAPSVPVSAPAVPTATASAVTQTPPAPEPAADLVIVPMKVTLDPKVPAVELKKDGTLWASLKGKTSQFGVIAKNELRLDDAGKHVVSVWKDNTVTIPDSTKKVRFDDKDDLIIEGGGKISIDDKGNASMVKSDGTVEKKSPKFTGYKPTAKRAAMLVLMMSLMAAEPVPSPQTVEGPAVQPKH